MRNRETYDIQFKCRINYRLQNEQEKNDNTLGHKKKCAELNKSNSITAIIFTKVRGRISTRKFKFQALG